MSGCGRLALLRSLSRIYCGWHSVVPVHAHLQQPSELWTLKQMVFLPPLTLFFIMPPTFVVQGQSRGWNRLIVCSVLLWGIRDETLLRRWLFLSCLNFPIQLCLLSQKGVLWVRVFHVVFSGNRGKFPISKSFVLDIFYLHLGKKPSLLHRSNPFALVTTGQRLSVPIVTIETRPWERREAQFKAASKENHKQAIYSSLYVIMMLRCVTLSCIISCCEVNCAVWTLELPDSYGCQSRTSSLLQVHSNHFPAGLCAVTLNLPWPVLVRQHFDLPV